MINEIKQSITSKLLATYPEGFNVYDEDIPENYAKPYFLITLTKQTYGKRLNNRFKSTLSFDIAYFSDKDSTGIKVDCWNVQQNLFRAFDKIDGCRISNKQAEIKDNVLHFTFDVSYSEIKEEICSKMQRKQAIIHI